MLSIVVDAMARWCAVLISVAAHAAVPAARQGEEAQSARSRGDHGVATALRESGKADDTQASMDGRQRAGSTGRGPVRGAADGGTIASDVFAGVAKECGGRLDVKVQSIPPGPLISDPADSGVPVLAGQGEIQYNECLGRGGIGPSLGVELRRSFFWRSLRCTVVVPLRGHEPHSRMFFDVYSLPIRATDLHRV